MSLRIDVARLVAVKHQQSMHSRMAASVQVDQAEEKVRQAEALRRSAQGLLGGAVANSEDGLSRQALFERLRLIALARAHAMESVQHAVNLEEQADEARRNAEQLRDQARHHERKKRKIEHWQRLNARAIAQRKQRRIENEIQETYACQFQR